MRDGSYICGGDHLLMYKKVKLVFCTPEANIILYVIILQYKRDIITALLYVLAVCIISNIAHNTVISRFSFDIFFYADNIMCLFELL